MIRFRCEPTQSPSPAARISLTLSSGATAGTLTGGISISGSLTIDPGAANGGSATLSNVIQDAANGAGSITLNTARTLTLTGANTYSGGTTISGGGTIVAGNPGVPNGSLGQRRDHAKQWHAGKRPRHRPHQ